MLDHLLESSHQDDSINWSNIGFGEEITQVELIGVNLTHLIWSSGARFTKLRKVVFTVSLFNNIK